jgi:twitching motility protein PilT
VSLERLLVAASKAGGSEVRLVPGRRIVILTPAGEREVQGVAQTAESIEQLLAPALEAAGLTLGGGRAEWMLPVPGVGPAQAVAERRGSTTQAAFRFAGASAVEAPSPEPPPAAAPRPARFVGPKAEMDELFWLMQEQKASDLHVCVGSPPLLRKDGDIVPVPGRAALTPADTERMLMAITPERNREEFHRRHDTDFAYELKDLGRFRCNLFMDRRGLGGVFRIIPTRILTAEEMGLGPEILQLCSLPKGLVLVTGPTGSGKSTTLAALVDHVNRTRSDHIITIEDPLEFVHENQRCLINQRQVHEHTDSFKDALRAALREDPDVVLVGEMRDLETVAIAIETAETGHLVFGTLHTSSAASTVDRIIDQFPADRQSQIRVMLAESLKAVISQVLCKKIGGGRVPALEVLMVTPSVSNLIREAKVFQIPSIMQTGKKYGMCQLNDALLDLVRRKLVEPREAWQRSPDKPGLVASFKKSGIDVSWAPGESAS